MKRILAILNVEFLIKEDAFKNWRIILYVLILAVVMIASGHSTDKKIFKIASLNEEIRLLKSEFIDQRTYLMNLKMETKIMAELSPLGIGPSKEPAIKIIVSND
ncbi:MAG: FtsL-like putative cell division protein [Bacteroidota bacterium]|nr:FtsL-like putative cell division protein [Bacteroidota bacterium]